MGESLRFLVVIDNFHPLVGGAERVALASARALVARGHEVQVLTMRKDAAWPAEETVHGVQVVRFDERVPRRPFGRLLYERANAAAAAECFRRQLDAERFDALLLHPIDAAFGVSRAAARLRAARVYCFHAPLGAEAREQADGLAVTQRGVVKRLVTRLSGRCAARYRQREQRRAIAASDAVTCPSRYARSLLEEFVPEEAHGRARVVPWGVDASRFQPAEDRALVRRGLGWRADDLVMLTVRRLVPRMGLDRLIRAFGCVAAERPQARLVVVGDGPLRQALEALAAATPGRITFTGKVPAPDLIRHYQGADLFLLPPARLEAFGLVVLESLACGTPVLAADAGGPPEILRPLAPRLVIPSKEPEGIAEAVLGHGVPLAGDSTFRQRCRAYAAENYTWDSVAAAFEQLARNLHEDTSAQPRL